VLPQLRAEQRLACGGLNCFCMPAVPRTFEHCCVITATAYMATIQNSLHTSRLHKVSGWQW